VASKWELSGTDYGQELEDGHLESRSLEKQQGLEVVGGELWLWRIAETVEELVTEVSELQAMERQGELLLWLVELWNRSRFGADSRGGVLEQALE